MADNGLVVKMSCGGWVEPKSRYKVVKTLAEAGASIEEVLALADGGGDCDLEGVNTLKIEVMSARHFLTIEEEPPSEVIHENAADIKAATALLGPDAAPTGRLRMLNAGKAARLQQEWRSEIGTTWLDVPQIAVSILPPHTPPASNSTGEVVSDD